MQLQNTLALTSAELEKSQIFKAFETVLVGFLFVFCVLIVLTLATLIMGKIFARLPVKKAQVTANTVSKKPLKNSKLLTTKAVNDSDSAESNPHYIAVIAAAIHCTLDGHKHRIVSIRSKNSN